MIPPLDPATGNLPPGVHEATWEEFTARYGYNAERQSLLTGVQTALMLLRAAGCRRVYIDGSFVSAKALPGDFDACWEVEGVDIPGLIRRAPELFDLRPPRAAQIARYRGELFPAQVSADSLGTAFLEYFQHDKHTGNPKGIVAIDLGLLP